MWNVDESVILQGDCSPQPRRPVDKECMQFVCMQQDVLPFMILIVSNLSKY